MMQVCIDSAGDVELEESVFNVLKEALSFGIS